MSSPSTSACFLNICQLFFGFIRIGVPSLTQCTVLRHKLWSQPTWVHTLILLFTRCKTWTRCLTSLLLLCLTCKVRIIITCSELLVGGNKWWMYMNDICCIISELATEIMINACPLWFSLTKLEKEIYFPPPLCLQDHSLHLYLHSFPANGFINTIFLDSVHMC